MKKGFSLIEVIITTTLIASVMIGVVSLLRSGFEVQSELNQKSRVNHRLMVAMQRLSEDLEHAFIISKKHDRDRDPKVSRKTKGYFRIHKGSGQDQLYLTTQSHKPIRAGANESDMTFVQYELRDSKDASGRKDLYRGSLGVVPESFREEPPMKLLVRNISLFDIEYWRGDKFEKSRWDSDSSDTRGLMPHMVRIKLKGWSIDRTDEDPPDGDVDQQMESLTSIIYLPGAAHYPELKAQNSTIRWRDF